MKRTGFNWVEGLQKLIYIFNKTAKRIFGYRTPFEIYHARGNAAGSKRTRSHLKKIAKVSHEKFVSKTEGTVSSYRVGEREYFKVPVQNIQDSFKAIHTGRHHCEQ